MIKLPENIFSIWGADFHQCYAVFLMFIALARHGLDISCYLGYEWLLKMSMAYITIRIALCPNHFSTHCWSTCSAHTVYLTAAVRPAKGLISVGKWSVFERSLQGTLGTYKINGSISFYDAFVSMKLLSSLWQIHRP
jgi:hypothetical protein